MDHDYAAAQTQDEPFRRTRGRRRINVLRTQEIPTPPPPPAIDDEDIFGDVEQSDEETQEPADVDSDFTQPPVLDMEATSDNATDNVDPDDQPGPSRHLPLIVPIILPPSYINFGSSMDSTDTSNTASTMSSSASASTITSMDSSSTSTTQTIEIPDSPALATAGDTENSNSTDGDTMEGTEANAEEGTEADAEAGPEAGTEESTEANAEAAAPSTPPASTTPGRKRRRVSLSPSTLTPKVKVDANGETEDDEGLTCPICLDSWEMSGDHRLVALRCGHLFGDVCIRRWLNESARQSGLKVCPQCKTKATIKDIRYLYARRLRAVDRSEEHHLREMLDDELKRSQNLMTELATLRMTNALNKNRIEALEQDNERMKRLLRSGISLLGYSADSNPNAQSPQYKLYLERNIDISREPGCRVMIYAKQQRAVIVSQKSSQTLFPGYGVRFVDTQTFRTSRFMHVSLKIVRDLCLSQDQQSLVVTSQEPRSKLFDLRTGKVATQFVPGITPLWSCAMDRNDRENYLYLGGHGNTYVYDIRKPDQVVHEYSVAEDSTPVIQVSAVIPNKLYPNGGFLVCSLRSLYFYEYEATGARPTRLNVEGPFVSMNYSTLTETILISTRCSPNYPQARYIIGSLDKVDDTSVFSVKATFHGSKIVPVMTRPSQIAVEANTLVAGYVQDVKFLSLYDVRRDTRVQSVAVQETVFDTCPIYLPDATYLTALTENKCRIYKVSPVT